jgi:hypothetical protein
MDLLILSLCKMLLQYIILAVYVHTYIDLYHLLLLYLILHMLNRIYMILTLLDFLTFLIVLVYNEISYFYIRPCSFIYCMYTSIIVVVVPVDSKVEVQVCSRMY